jgi:DNA segregation ATPase FtsK/SpoIIIE-like protein
LAEDKTQANILVKGCEAHQIENKGRCYARLPGSNRITEMQTPFVSEAEILAIAPHIQDKAAPPVTKPATDAPPLSFVVTPDPNTPTDDEMAIIEAVKQVEYDHGKIVWSKVTKQLGWTATGPNNDRIKAVLDKWNVSY